MQKNKDVLSQFYKDGKLTKDIVDLLIEAVYVFPDKHIDIHYKIKDMFE